MISVHIRRLPARSAAVVNDDELPLAAVHANLIEVPKQGGGNGRDGAIGGGRKGNMQDLADAQAMGIVHVVVIEDLLDGHGVIPGDFRKNIAAFHRVGAIFGRQLERLADAQLAGIVDSVEFLDFADGGSMPFGNLAQCFAALYDMAGFFRDEGRGQQEESCGEKAEPGVHRHYSFGE